MYIYNNSHFFRYATDLFFVLFFLFLYDSNWILIVLRMLATICSVYVIYVYIYCTMQGHCYQVSQYFAVNMVNVPKL